MVWRLRWRVTHSLWPLAYRGRFRVFVMKDGLGASLFYTGSTEPEIEEFVVRFLKPGMRFVDVGAHVGIYSLLAAAAVGPAGEVISFEPNPEARRVLELNIAENRFHNVRVRGEAVADAAGMRDFEICEESSVSSLNGGAGEFPKRRSSRLIKVESTTLDAALGAGGESIHLIKIDAEGAELPVLKGASSLLGSPAAVAPILIFECEPGNYAFFGYTPQDVFGYLESRGFAVYCCQGKKRFRRVSMRDVPSDVKNLIAAKEGACFPFPV